jgi:hypothetical protein
MTKDAAITGSGWIVTAARHPPALPHVMTRPNDDSRSPASGP